MPVSLKRLTETMDVKRTGRNKGTVLTLHVVEYDNGMLEVDGVPMADGRAEGGYADVAEVVMSTINEFRRQAETSRRRK